MNEEEKIEPGSQDGKHERPVEVHSNIVQEQTGKPVETNQTSEISKSEIKEMEVYHHPKVEKKNFKEYLLEGLMIFIAVTMGFIAENVREHFAEEKTKSAYLETFEHELLKNKDVFNKSQSRFRELYTSEDTMANIFLRKEENQDVERTQTLRDKAKRIFLPDISQYAYMQLVNSGGLKYINNQSLINSMAVYEQQIENFFKYNDIVNNSIVATYPTVAGIEDNHLSANEKFQVDSTVVAYPKMTSRERLLMSNSYSLLAIKHISDADKVNDLNKRNENLLEIVKKELNQ